MSHAALIADHVSCRVEELAKKKGASMAQVAIAWMLSKEGVSAPIVGSTSLKNLEDILGAHWLTLACSAVSLLDGLRRTRCKVDGGRNQVPRRAVPASEDCRTLVSGLVLAFTVSMLEKFDRVLPQILQKRCAIFCGDYVHGRLPGASHWAVCYQPTLMLRDVVVCSSTPISHVDVKTPPPTASGKSVRLSCYARPKFALGDQRQLRRNCVRF